MKKVIYKMVGTYLKTLAFIAPNVAAKKGFKLFCYPARGPLKEHHKHFLNPAKHEVTKYKNDDIQVYKWGNGQKKLLFLHGWQSHSYRWKSYVEKLDSNEFTIYALDAPGHGLSSGKMLHVPLYSEVIKEFLGNHGQFDVVIAHSMGCFALALALHHHPDLPVKKIIMMGSPGEAMDFVDVYRNLLSLNDHVINLTLSYFQKISGTTMDYYPMPRFVKNLTQPGLIIHDKNDPEAPYEHVKKFNKAWENSILLTTEGLTHNLKSDEVIESVKKFIYENNVVNETLIQQVSKD